MKYSLWLVFLNIYGLGISVLNAQETLVFRTLGAEQGLSRRPVISIAESSEGTLWLGTADGLFLMEGGRIYAASQKLAPGNDLPAGVITTLVYDPFRNYLWVATDGAGLFSIDICLRTVERYYNSGAVLYVKAQAVTAVCVMPEAVFCGTRNEGLFRLDFSQKKVNHFRSSKTHPGSIPSAGIDILLPIHSHKLLIGTTGAGAWIWDTEQNWCQATETGAPLSVNYALISGENEILMSTSQGLYHQNFSGKILRQISCSGILNSRIRSIIPFRKGYLLMTATQGIQYYNPAKQIIFPVKSNFPAAGGYGMLQDAEGNIWMGSEAGLSIVSAGKQAIELLRPATVKVFDIYAVHAEVNGLLYAGSAGKGLWCFSDHQGWMMVPGSEGLDIVGLTRIQNELWISTYGQGVWTYDRIHSIQPRNIYPYVYGIIQDAEGRIWAGTEQQGVFYSDPPYRKFIQMEATEGYSASTIQVFSGQLYFAAYDKGMMRYNRNTGEISSFRPPGTRSWVQGIYSMDSTHLFAAMYGEGLWVWDLNREEWCRPVVHPELSGAVISSVLEADSGWWITTHSGLWRLDPSGEIHKIRWPVHALMPEFNAAAFSPGTDGNIYLGSAQGIWKADPKQIQAESGTQISLRIFSADFRVLHSDCNSFGDAELISFPLSVQADIPDGSHYIFRIRELNPEGFRILPYESFLIPWLPGGDWTLEILPVEGSTGVRKQIFLRVRGNDLSYRYAVWAIGIVFLLILGWRMWQKYVRNHYRE